MYVMATLFNPQEKRKIRLTHGNPTIVIKVGNRVIGTTNESRTPSAAKKTFLNQYSGHSQDSVTATIKH